MESHSSTNKRIARNTIVLYFRLLLTMGVSLYTSRVVLEALGVEDYGIYNVVGGVVAMLSVLTGSLSSAISRFLTFELGRKDKERLERVFSTSLSIQLAMAIIVFVVGEIVAVWFLNTYMNIPQERMHAANWVLQSAILSFVVTLISVPYNAAIIAHEKMSIFATISIIDVALKLLIVYVLFLTIIDRLIVYSILMFAVVLTIQFIYQLYCKRSFSECHYRRVYDKQLIREMLGFSCWNFIGSSSSVLRTQGINILLNIFFGTVVNAARGIAVQVNVAVTSFTSNFITALRPQIVKSYASGQFDYMNLLVRQGARFSYYLVFLLSLPLLLETKFVLALWLKEVPEYTVIFVRLILILSISDSISNTLIIANAATGRVRNYQLVVGGIQLLNFPISWMLLNLGYAPEVTLYIAIVLSQICFFSRLIMIRHLSGFSCEMFLRKVYMNVLGVSVLSVCLPLFFAIYFPEGIQRFFLVLGMSLISSLLVMFFVGCSTREREGIILKIKGIQEYIRGQFYH